MPNWTKEQFHAYLLLYCIHADYKVSPEEENFVKSKIGADLYAQMQAEWQADKDFARINKIQIAFDQLGYAAPEADKLFAEIKALFLADGQFDVLEQNIFRGLRKLLT